MEKILSSGVSGKPSVAARGAVLFPMVAVLIWSGNTVISKLAASVIAPDTISFYRWLIALAILTPWLALPTWKNRQRIKPYLSRLAVLGCLGMAAYQGLSYVAAQTSSAVNMGIIVALVPLMSAVLSSVLANEPLTRGCLIGGAISLVGVVYLLSQGHPSALLHTGFVVGDVVMFVGALGYALYSVLLRRWAMPIPTWQSLYMQISFGLLCILPWYLMTPASPITADNIGFLLYAALLASLVAPYVWFRGIAVAGPGRLALYFNLVPVFVIVIAVMVAGESLHAYHMVGGLLALAGVILGQYWRTPVKQTQRAIV